MAWLSQFFINPAFVIPGAALIAVPIAIHLINRMRYRRVKFAAMEFLLASQQRNRRKLLIEQLLLLALRCLAVLALVALIARPFFDPSQLLILQGQKTRHVVLIDDTESMQNRWGETSAFESALDVLRRITQQGARQPGTQILTVVRLSQLDPPLFRDQDIDAAFLNELETRLESLRCTYRESDLAPGLERARELLKEPAAGKHLHVLSDFRRHDWQDDAALTGVMKELDSEGITVNLVHCVPEPSPNLAVTELSGNVHVAAASVPVRLRVGVRNFGEQEANAVRLSILEDGKKLPLSIVVEKLAPGKEAFREFDVVFPNAGKHEIHVSLPPDPLEADNTRFLALDISEANPVLIIASDLSEAGDARFLEDALAPAPGTTGFAPVVESVDFLSRHPLQQYQCIYMVDVPEIRADSLRFLEEYVAAGGGLVWFVGPQVRPAFYNDKLFKEGAGLFPAPLGTVAELTVDATNPAPDIDFEDHPVFAPFQGQDNPYVENVKINRYFTLARDAKVAANAQVLASLRNKAPLFFESRFGAGRILTSLTTCGVEWNNWPRNPSYVLLQLELEKHVARNDRLLERRIVGEPIEISLDPAVYRSQLEIRAPSGEIVRLNATPQQIEQDGQARDADANIRLVATFGDTGEPGVYVVTRYRQDDQPDVQMIGYNVPIQGSELALATNDQIRKRLGGAGRVQIQDYGQFEWLQGNRGKEEVVNYVLMLLLVILLIEQLLALRLSFHPKMAGAPA